MPKYFKTISTKLDQAEFEALQKHCNTMGCSISKLIKRKVDEELERELERSGTRRQNPEIIESTSGTGKTETPKYRRFL